MDDDTVGKHPKKWTVEDYLDYVNKPNILKDKYIRTVNMRYKNHTYRYYSVVIRSTKCGYRKTYDQAINLRNLILKKLKHEKRSIKDIIEEVRNEFK